MGKILVKKSVDVQYPVSGAPILVTGGGGGGGASPRGMTLQEALGRLGGGTLGALSAATGQHRSLGGLAQSMVSGAAQGRAIGGGLGRIATTRAGQQRANLREKLKQKEAEEKALAQTRKRNRGEGFLTNLLNPIGAYNRRVKDRAAGRLDFARQMNREAENYSRNMAELYRDIGRERFNQIRRPQLQQERAKLLAAAKARGGELGAEDKRRLEMLDRIQRQTGAPNLEQAFNTLLGTNQTASPPPEQVGSNVNIVGGKLTVNGQEVEPDAQGNYSAPGVRITGSSIGGGGDGDKTQRAMEMFAQVQAEKRARQQQMIDAGLIPTGPAAGMRQPPSPQVNVGVVNPSEMSEAQRNAIENTMARRNRKPLATEESHPTQQKIGAAFSNVLATQKPETGNPLGNFDNSAMNNSPLATQGLGAAVTPPPTGAGTELNNVQTAANTQMAEEGLDDKRSNLDINFDKLGPPRAEPIVRTFSGDNPNVKASRDAERDFDFAGYNSRYAIGDDENVNWMDKKSEPMELAFRLLKMMIFNR